jgi:hypothetical protein
VPRYGSESSARCYTALICLNDNDGPHHQEPALVTNLLKGDATWSTRKTVLGWVLDTVNKTIQLPTHRLERRHTIMASIPTIQHRTSTKKWQQTIRKIRSMALSVPGACGIFFSLQEALRHKANDGTRVRPGCHIHSFLEDFCWLADGLATHPTSMIEVIPSTSPATRGACDASGKEMGGVHFVPGKDDTIQAYVFLSPLPFKVMRQLVTTANLTGKINNINLDLAGSVAHHDILSQLTNLQDVTIHNCYDNTSTLFWQRKGSAKTTEPAVYLL